MRLTISSQVLVILSSTCTCICVALLAASEVNVVCADAIFLQELRSSEVSVATHCRVDHLCICSSVSSFSDSSYISLRIRIRSLYSLNNYVFISYIFRDSNVCSDFNLARVVQLVTLCDSELSVLVRQRLLAMECSTINQSQLVALAFILSACVQAPSLSSYSSKRQLLSSSL